MTGGWKCKMQNAEFIGIPRKRSDRGNPPFLAALSMGIPTPVCALARNDRKKGGLGMTGVGNGKCKMQNAKCKMRNLLSFRGSGATVGIPHSLQHHRWGFPRQFANWLGMTEKRGLGMTGGVEMQNAKCRMQNAECIVIPRKRSDRGNPPFLAALSMGIPTPVCELARNDRKKGGSE